MKRVAAAFVAVVAAVLLGAVGAAGAWRALHPTTASAAPLPHPTPCRVFYVGDDGSQSCLAIPSFGMEPYP